MNDDDLIVLPPRPCVGLPVQFHTANEVLPGFLQRQHPTDPELWDVKVSLTGAHSLVTRSACRYSPLPAPGCWSFIDW